MVDAATSRLQKLAAEISRCRICCDPSIENPLPHEPRPVVVVSTNAKIAICGQAPGTRVHASGIPFSDPSGERLRDWMGVGAEEFYDPDKFAILPMGFCFPGLDTKGGDLPPRRECAKAWRTQLMQKMPQLKLLLVIGLYAQNWHIGKHRQKNLTQTVAAWRDIASQNTQPIMLPLPHPSWRNNGWLKKNSWFTSDLVPELKKMIQGELV